MAEMGHLLAAAAHAVQEQLDFIEVRVRPNGDRLAFASFPVPVWQQVQHWIVSPPCLVIEEIVFRKAAGVHDAKLRADGWPAVGRGLAAIVEARPGKATGKPLTLGVELPPLLRQLGPVSMVHIVGTDPVSQFVGGIETTRRDCTGGFGANQRFMRIGLAVSIDILEGIVESFHIERLGDRVIERGGGGGGAQTGGIELVAAANHSRDNSLTRRLKLQRPLLVAHPPQND